MFGVQAAGKGTQAKMISDKYQLPHISTGDIFRSLDTSTELGKMVRDLIDNGHMVPDDKTCELVKNYLDEKGGSGYILDGFPRNPAQAEILDKFAEATPKIQPQYVLSIEITDEEAMRRLSGRRMCKDCGAIYNINTAPKPKSPDNCDKCEGPLYQRKDDTPEAISERLKDYHNKTEPIKEFYKGKGILYELDGMKDIEEVFTDITALLDSSD